MNDLRLQKLFGVYPLADDDPRWRHDPKAIVESSLSGGARVVQLRAKRSTDRECLELARWASKRAHDFGALLLVNDRIDLADLAGADGVHLGQDDLPPEHIPIELRQRLLVGLSTHDLNQVRESRNRPVDYIAFGPIFRSESKTSAYDARGLRMLERAVREAHHPVVAIGGIGLRNMAHIRRTGAVAAAVISAIADTDDPESATRALQQAFLK